MTIPFTYIIKSIHGGIYVGSRYGKDAHPEQLLVSYFTSSASVEPIVKANPGQWKIIRLQKHATLTEAVRLEQQWQLEFKSHPNFLNRHIVNVGFANDVSGASNPMAIRWTLQDPDGVVYAQPASMSGAEFLSSLGHSAQMLTKYRKERTLPANGSFAGWKILKCERAGKNLIDFEFTTRVKKLRTKKEKSQKSPEQRRGTLEFKAKKAEANKRNDTASFMHTKDSRDRAKASKRKNSIMCQGPFLVTFRDGTAQIVPNLLDFADSNGYPRNTIGHLYKNKITAAQGKCRGMSITKL